MQPPMRKVMDRRQKIDIENARLKMVGCPVVCCVANASHILPHHVRFDLRSNVDGDSENVDATARMKGSSEASAGSIKKNWRVVMFHGITACFIGFIMAPTRTYNMTVADGKIPVVT